MIFILYICIEDYQVIQILATSIISTSGPLKEHLQRSKFSKMLNKVIEVKLFFRFLA